MRIPNPPNEADAKRAAEPRPPLAAGQHRGTITAASEGVSPNNNATLRLLVAVVDGDGVEHRLVDVLSPTPRGILRLRHAAASVDALAEFGSGEVDARRFIGREVVITTEIQPKKGAYPARAVIIDYAAVAPAGVSALRRIIG